MATQSGPHQLWGKFENLTILALGASEATLGVVAVVAWMPVWHGVWKTSEPLSDLDQWLNIAKHDPNVNAK